MLRTSQSDRDLLSELTTLLNCYSAENQSNTPDFILAEYVIGCLDAFNSAVKRRTRWYNQGEDLKRPETRGQLKSDGSFYDIVGL